MQSFLHIEISEFAVASHAPAFVLYISMDVNPSFVGSMSDAIRIGRCWKEDFVLRYCIPAYLLG